MSTSIVHYVPQAPTWFTHCFKPWTTILHFPFNAIPARFVAETTGKKLGDVVNVNLRRLLKSIASPQDLQGGIGQLLSLGIGTVVNGVYRVDVSAICAVCKPFWDAMAGGALTGAAAAQVPRSSNASSLRPVLPSSFLVVASPGKGQRACCYRYLVTKACYESLLARPVTEDGARSLARAARRMTRRRSGRHDPRLRLRLLAGQSAVPLGNTRWERLTVFGEEGLAGTGRNDARGRVEAQGGKSRAGGAGGSTGALDGMTRAGMGPNRACNEKGI